MSEEILDLSERVRDEVISGRLDLTAISDSCDKILDLTDKIPKENRWKLLKLFKVEPLPFFPSIKDITLPFDEEDTTFRPWRRSSVKPEQMQRFLWLLKQCTPLNGFTRIWNTILILIQIGGRQFLQNKILRMLAYYMDQFTEEPFVEMNDGTVVIECEDSAITMRLKLAVNCLWQSVSVKSCIDEELLIEQFKYFFQDPMGNCVKIKKCKHLGVTFMFSQPKGGFICDWDSMDLDTMKATPPSWDDYECYLAIRDEYEENTNKLIKEVPLFGKRVKKLLRGELNEENLGFMSYAIFYEAIVGYWRGDRSKILSKDIEESYSRNLKADPNCQLAKNVYDKWAMFFRNWKIPTKKEYFNGILNELTTRSTGLRSRMPGDKDDRLANPQIDVDVSKFFDRQGAKTVKLTNKVLAMYYQPDRYSVDWNEFEKSLTKEYPGRIFFRNVMARDDRAVFGGILCNHNIESSVVRDLMSYQGSNLCYYNGKPKFTLELDTGRPFTDHRRWLFESSKGKCYIRATDFSGYDQSEAFLTVRKPAIRALLDSTAHTKCEPIMNGKTLPELLAMFWAKLENAHYEIDMGPKFKDAEEGARKRNFLILLTNFMLSGEFGTLVGNNMTNDAFFDIVRELVAREFPFFSTDEVRMQGDDCIDVNIPTAEFRMKSQIEQGRIIRKLLERIAEEAEKNNLKVNAVKTMFSKSGFEFLKKYGKYGYIITRYLQVNLNEKENTNRVDDPVSRMSSRIGEMREWVWRGGSFKQALMRIFFEWNLIRTVKVSGSEKVILPYAILWCPLSLKGCGLHSSGYFLDPNLDMLIHATMLPEKINKTIGLYVAACRNSKSDTMASFVKKMTPYFAAGEKYIKQNEDEKRVQASIEAVRALENSGGHPGFKFKQPYYERPTIAISEAISDNPSFAEIKVKDKLEFYSKVIKKMSLLQKSEKVDGWQDVWVSAGVSFSLGEEVDFKLPLNPVPGLDPLVGQWLRNVGTTSGYSQEQDELFKAFHKVVTDRAFPKNLKSFRPEAMAKEMLQHSISTSEDIMMYLVAKGANYDSAMMVATKLQGKLQQLQFMSEIHAYSIAGEGYSPKDLATMKSWVSIPINFGDNSSMANLLYSLGFQYMRSQPLYNAKGEYVKRRKVQVNVTDFAVFTYMAKQYGYTDAVYAVSKGSTVL